MKEYPFTDLASGRTVWLTSDEAREYGRFEMARQSHRGRERKAVAAADVNLSDSDLYDTIVGSGASTYPWYSNWESDEERLTLTVSIDCEGTKDGARLTVGTLRRAIASREWHDHRGVPIDWSDPEVDSEVDADIADQIVQTAVLGDVVFG